MAEEKEQIELDLGDSQETEVEVSDNEKQQVDVSLEAESDDNFDKAENATQKRIDRLTKKMREAERQREEALKYAQGVQAEAHQLKQRMDALDNNYVNEYSNRVESQIVSAEEKLAKAIEMGDTNGVIEAQRSITRLAIENDRAQQAKVQQQRYAQQIQAQQQAAVNQPMPQQQPRRPDPKAEQWAQKNTWFGDDEAMTYAAFGIHKKLVEDEGFDPQSNDYYNELDRRMQTEFPHKLNGGSKRPAQTVASVSRNTSGRSSGKKVRLTPSQVAIAKKLGVPLEEYAKYVKE
jgi:hypothetical protein|tara:strand:+ start:1383 stop:2255 length:873 start_codon:yes stop_codon:yes gene_type:complete